MMLMAGALGSVRCPSACTACEADGSGVSCTACNDGRLLYFGQCVTRVYCRRNTVVSGPFVSGTLYTPQGECCLSYLKSCG